MRRGWNLRRTVGLAVVPVVVAACAVIAGRAVPARAAAGDFTVTPTTLDFPDTYVGSEALLTITIENVSSTSQTPSFAGGAPSDATNFGGFQDCAGKTFAPGDTCQFTYEFHPTTPGAKSTSTTIGIDGENFPITMSGTGLFPFTVTPTTLDFPDTAVGDTSTLPVTIENVSPTSQSPTFAGGAPLDPTNFGGFQDCAGKAFAPGDTCQFTYEFHPTTPGAKSTSTTIGIDGENFPIALAGRGVVAVATTTALASSVNPSLFGQSVTFRATVDAPSVPDVPTGSVTFFDTTTASTLGTVALDASGAASLTTNALSAGSHAIRATYNPDSASFTGSSASLNQVVNPAPTTVALALTPNPSTLGQPVTLTADVTAPPPSQVSPTGSVTIVDLTTGATLGTAGVHSQATLVIDGLAAGTHVLQATFTADSANFASATADITQTVLTPSGQTLSGPTLSVTSLRLGVLAPATPVVGVARFTG